MTTPAPDPGPDKGAGAAPAPTPATRDRAATGGERRLLTHAPGERYRRDAQAPAAAGSNRTSGSTTGVRRLVLAAVAVAIVGAAVLTLILGVLLSTAGTFAISGIASIAIGLIVANGAIPGPGASGAGPSAPLLTRDRAVRIAMGTGLGMIVLTALGVWVLARLEGGVMDPISYVWTTFGFGLPAQAIIALIGAAWGAANGPVRWRQ